MTEEIEEIEESDKYGKVTLNFRDGTSTDFDKVAAMNIDYKATPNLLLLQWEGAEGRALFFPLDVVHSYQVETYEKTD